jgi:predicted GIY-YIG superfamily endonuclease
VAAGPRPGGPKFLSSSGLTGARLHAPLPIARLVWFEAVDDVRAAIQREKTLKHWLRAWRIALIEPANPTWRDLYDEIGM